MTIRSTAAATARRAIHAIARGVLRKAHDGSKMQEVDLDLMHGEMKSGVEHWHPYGITTVPKAGAEALVVFPGGNRSHGIVIACADRRYRLTGLEEGDIALHDDSGQMVKLGRSGMELSSPQPISVKSSAGISLEAPSASVKGDMSFEGNASFNGNVAIKGGSLTHNEKNVGSTHTHSGVQPGGGSTNVPN